MGHGNRTTLGWTCHTRAAPSCDMFNLGSSYFHVPLTTVHHLLNVYFLPNRMMTVLLLLDSRFRECRSLRLSSCWTWTTLTLSSALRTCSTSRVLSHSSDLMRTWSDFILISVDSQWWKHSTVTALPCQICCRPTCHDNVIFVHVCGKMNFCSFNFQSCCHCHCCEKKMMIGWRNAWYFYAWSMN